VPNANYEKGRRAEYKCCEALADAGWIPIRSAGSKSPIDVIGVGNGKVRLIQVKSGKKGVSPADIEVLLNIYHATENCTVEAWHYEPYKDVNIMVIGE
jgi:Holliday junction resolvase